MQMRKLWIGGVGLAMAMAFTVAVVEACSDSQTHEFGTADDAGDEDFTVDANFTDGNGGPCGLKCRQTTCEGGKTTSISGVVLDPAGQLPIYNAIVYVPQEALKPFPSGATCDKCGTLASGLPLVTTLTDAKGHFVLENMPTGADVPVVVQVGKWRRQLTVPNVAACTDTPITDTNLTRLPRKASEGDMPQIALVTGCDAMECFLRNIGIDDSEFTAPSGPGHVHMYQGQAAFDHGGSIPEGGAPDAAVLWDDSAQLSKYDLAIFACECAVHAESKPPEALAAVRSYVNGGGRLFAAHYHGYWIRDGGADLNSVGTWRNTESDNTVFGTELDVEQTFPKGQALAEWLVNVGASSKKGVLGAGGVAWDLTAANPTEATAWITTDPKPGQRAPTYLTFNTPVGQQDQCGRVVFTDLHVSANTDGKVFPSGCTDPSLTEREKALEFLFFDLSSCIQKDSDPPVPPR